MKFFKKRKSQTVIKFKVLPHRCPPYGPKHAPSYYSPSVIWPKYCRHGVKHYIINQSILLFSRRYMAEILPIRRKTLHNQSINQTYFSPAIIWPKYCRYGVKHYIINQSILRFSTIVKHGLILFIILPKQFSIDNFKIQTFVIQLGKTTVFNIELITVSQQYKIATD